MSNQFNENELILDLKEYLAKIPAGCLNIANLLRNNQISEAANGIVDLSEGLQWVNSVINYFKTKEIHTSMDEKELIAFLEEINEALAVQDFYLTADLLEYEMIPYFEKALISLKSGENYRESN